MPYPWSLASGKSFSSVGLTPDVYTQCATWKFPNTPFVRCSLRYSAVSIIYDTWMPCLGHISGPLLPTDSDGFSSAILLLNSHYKPHCSIMIFFLLLRSDLQNSRFAKLQWECICTVKQHACAHWYVCCWWWCRWLTQKCIFETIHGIKTDKVDLLVTNICIVFCQTVWKL